jgi:hypothetical protein
VASLPTVLTAHVRQVVTGSSPVALAKDTAVVLNLGISTMCITGSVCLAPLALLTLQVTVSVHAPVQICTSTVTLPACLLQAARATRLPHRAVLAHGIITGLVQTAYRSTLSTVGATPMITLGLLPVCARQVITGTRLQVTRDAYNAVGIPTPMGYTLLPVVQTVPAVAMPPLITHHASARSLVTLLIRNSAAVVLQRLLVQRPQQPLHPLLWRIHLVCQTARLGNTGVVLPVNRST